MLFVLITKIFNCNGQQNNICILSYKIVSYIFTFSTALNFFFPLSKDLFTFDSPDNIQSFPRIFP